MWLVALPRTAAQQRSPTNFSTCGGASIPQSGTARSEIAPYLNQRLRRWVKASKGKKIKKLFCLALAGPSGRHILVRARIMSLLDGAWVFICAWVLSMNHRPGWELRRRCRRLDSRCSSFANPSSPRLPQSPRLRRTGARLRKLRRNLYRCIPRVALRLPPSPGLRRAGATLGCITEPRWGSILVDPRKGGKRLFKFLGHDAACPYHQPSTLDDELLRKVTESSFAKATEDRGYGKGGGGIQMKNEE